MTKEQLLGTWRLGFFRSITGDKMSYPLGEQPGGYIGFTDTRLWVMIVDTARSTPRRAGVTDDEAVALMKSSAAYTGKYDADPRPTADGIKVTIHVDAATNQAIVGTDRVFYMRVNDDKLSLVSPAMLIPISGLTSIVQLEFVKAD